MSSQSKRKPFIGSSTGLTLGRVLGAPVILSWSWFIAAAVITILFTPFVRTMSGGDLRMSAWVIAFCYAVLLFFSVFLHELAHGVAGRLYGQRVAAFELNIWGGFTKFEPKVEEDQRKSATTNFVVSIVGPIVNIVLALVGWLLLRIVPDGSVAWLLLVALVFANLALGVMNLFPGIPLDGGWALQALIWRATNSQYKGTIVASWIGRGIAVALIVVSVVVPMAAGQRPDYVTIISTTAIALMLWFSAGDAATHAKRARKMENYDLDQVIQPAIAATWDSEVAHALAVANSMGAAGDQTLIIVLNERGLPYGIVDRHAVAGLNEEVAQTSLIHEFARPLGGWVGVPHEITAPHLLESLTHRPKAEFCLVMEGSTLTGLIDLQEFFDELMAV
ncbi:site-2 protease family protein [Brevibacterium sp. 50QC2O2]|uniref:site-2 protease family protein n=1 Tax=Brevibacterium sp. 50QC2O2 TaxID=2968459 RepID=UPI00211BDE90|nr:site-2 protease family protein [Brevibacterium sp. 50QC2O2]MCQ9388852.1 site-2 protease family protein [Brevibacterium sp. 50QC2O2]